MSAPTFFKKGAAIAADYGFASSEHAFPGKLAAAPPGGSALKNDALAGKICTLWGACSTNGRPALVEPMRLYFAEMAPPSSRKYKRVHFGLSILGSAESFSEAIIIKTALAILKEAGAPQCSVYVNSIGDRDSAARFAREVQSYLRKHQDALSSAERKILRGDIFDLLPMLTHEEHPLREGLPSTLEFLGEGSREHFREFLEYLESAEIPYAIDRHLLGHRDLYSQTIFEIRDPEGVSLARGGRYDEAGRRMYKTALPSVGVLIEREFASSGGSGASRGFPLRAPLRKPRVCFIQVGLGARQRSLSVIETLREARIPFYQPLGPEKLGEQLARAISLKIPYTIIMGAREAIDNTVIVRDMSTHAQNTVPLHTLPVYLKKIKF